MMLRKLQWWLWLHEGLDDELVKEQMGDFYYTGIKKCVTRLTEFIKVLGNYSILKNKYQYVVNILYVDLKIKCYKMIYLGILSLPFEYPL